MTLYSFLIDENLSPQLKHALVPHTTIHTRDLGENVSRLVALSSAPDTLRGAASWM